MLSAPTVVDPVEAELEPDYAESRLRGTVWHNGVAIVTYRGVLGAGGWLARIGVRPNLLTYLSLVIAGAAAIAAARAYFPLAAGLVVLSGMCDMLDGIVARVSGRVSRYGALLDSTVDRLADALPLLGVMAFYADAGGWILMVPAISLVGGFSISYVRARAEGLGARLPPLFMRRAERVALLIMTLLLGAVPVEGTVFGDAPAAPLLLVGVAVGGLLNYLGVIVALRSAQKELSRVPATSEHHTDLPSA